MFRKESMKEMMGACCGDMTGEDRKKMMDRCVSMMKPYFQGKEGGETEMNDCASRCASFMKHCCFPKAEGKAEETGKAEEK